MPGIPQPTSYRPEIDGLRALAILPVVLFHYRASGFRGGFVGVDVFFVISGYLITSLIQAEIARGTFSLLHFYERRVRRIFPGLFAMLAVASAAAYVFFFPVDLVRYAQSLFATALFGANFEFWREAGYFDVLANQKPLLHLWSIAVEEQFYLLFPALLILLRGRTARLRVAAVAFVFVASFALGVWGVGAAPVATFYLLPARAWELMLGALLALGAFPAIGSRYVSESLATLGVTLIGVSVFVFTPQMPFPGPAALLPCMGAALIIHCAHVPRTFVGSFLATPPLVFIGLISYSLYLWHWPIYVFATYLNLREPSGMESAALIALSFVLAALSWRFIEQPFRKSRGHYGRRVLFPGAAFAAGFTAATAAFATSTDGLPQRLAPDLQRILAEQDDHEPRIDRCFGMTAADVRERRLCTIGAKGVAPSFLLWGDSHADAILPALSGAAKRAGRAGLFAGGESCPPLLGVSAAATDCRAFNDAVIERAKDSQIREVIVEARWAKYAEGTPYGNEPKGRILLTDDSCTVSDLAGDNHAVFARGLARTVRKLKALGKTIVIVAAVPEIGWPVPAVLARRALAKDSDIAAIGPPLRSYLARQSFVMQVFNRLIRDDAVHVLYPHRILCATGACEVALNGVPLYRDEHHLSVFGASQLTPLMQKAF